MKKSQAGFSLVEVMIAVGILAVVALGISLSFNNASNNNRQVVLANTCQDVAASTLNYITNFGVSDHIISTLVVNDNSTTNNNFTGLRPSEMLIWGSDPQNVVTAAPIFVSAGPAPAPLYPILGNSQYIINGVNAAQQLYNSSTQYCQGGVIVDGVDAGVDVTKSLFGNNRLTQNVSNIYLHIDPFDLSTNSVVNGCPRQLVSAPQRSVPKPALGYAQPSNNPATDQFQIVGNSDLGFMATFTIVTAMGGQGTAARAGVPQKSCSVNVKLQHQRDSTPPVAPSNIKVSVGSGVTPLPPPGGQVPASQSFTSCDSSGAGYNILSVVIDTSTVTSYEPGSVVLCQTQTDNGGGPYNGVPAGIVFEPPNFTPPTPCGKDTYFSVGGVKYYAVPSTTIAANGRPIITMTFGGPGSLPGGPLPSDIRYNLRTLAIDTAGNKSTTFGYMMGSNGKQGLIIDKSRPTINALTPTPIASGSTASLIGHPEDGVMGRAVNNVANSYPHTWPASQNYIECDFVPGNPSPKYYPSWTGATTGSFPENSLKCSSCQIDGFATQCKVDAASTGTSCVGDSITPLVSPGTHTMTLFGQDVCGSSVAGTSQSWCSSQSFYGLQNPTGVINPVSNPPAVLYRNTGTLTDETINIIAPMEGTLRDSWYTRCDCDFPLALDNLACTPKTDQHACVTAVNNFGADAADICNRQVAVTGSYQIEGGPGDKCGTEPCNTSLSLICPQTTVGGYTQGICANYSGSGTCGDGSSAAWRLVAGGNKSACPPENCNAVSGCGAVGTSSWSGSLCNGVGSDTCVPTVNVQHCWNPLLNSGLGACDATKFPSCGAQSTCLIAGPGASTNCVYNGTCTPAAATSGTPVNPACTVRNVTTACGSGPPPTAAPTPTPTTVTTSTSSTVTTVGTCPNPPPGNTSCAYTAKAAGTCSPVCYGPENTLKDTCYGQFYACQNLGGTFAWLLQDCVSTSSDQCGTPPTTVTVTVTDPVTVTVTVTTTQNPGDPVLCVTGQVPITDATSVCTGSAACTPGSFSCNCTGASGSLCTYDVMSALTQSQIQTEFCCSTSNFPVLLTGSYPNGAGTTVISCYDCTGATSCSAIGGITACSTPTTTVKSCLPDGQVKSYSDDGSGACSPGFDSGQSCCSGGQHTVQVSVGGCTETQIICGAGATCNQQCINDIWGSAQPSPGGCGSKCSVLAPGGAIKYSIPYDTSGNIGYGSDCGPTQNCWCQMGLAGGASCP